MIHHGDCLDVMAGMPEASIDAIVADPPYGIGFMGHQWDQPGDHGPVRRGPRNEPGHPRTRAARARGESVPDAMEAGRYDLGPEAMRRYQAWCAAWGAAALRVAKPGGYLLCSGGTRTVHRLACGLEDAGWLIRDVLVWAYAQGFPKSKSSLKPAWEPIVMARKPGPLQPLQIDAARIGFAGDDDRWRPEHHVQSSKGDGYNGVNRGVVSDPGSGRWPANVVLTDPIFDGGWEGVVGGGTATSGKMMPTQVRGERHGIYGDDAADGFTTMETYGDTGTYSRFFLISKASRSEREPADVRGGGARRGARINAHPT